MLGQHNIQHWKVCKSMATPLSTSKFLVHKYVMSESEKKRRNKYHVELSMKSSLIYETHMTQSVILLCCLIRCIKSSCYVLSMDSTYLSHDPKWKTMYNIMVLVIFYQTQVEKVCLCILWPAITVVMYDILENAPCNLWKITLLRYSSGLPPFKALRETGVWNSRRDRSISWTRTCWTNNIWKKKFIPVLANAEDSNLPN